MKTRFIQIDEWSTHYTVKLMRACNSKPIEVQVCNKRNISYLNKIVKDLKSTYNITEVIEKRLV